MSTRRAVSMPGGVGPLLLAWVGLAWLVVLLPLVRESVIRSVVVFPMAVLVPGYALLSLLSPTGDSRLTRGVPGRIAEFVLAVALSVAVSILVGITLLTIAGGVTALSALVALSAVTLGALLAGRSNPRPWSNVAVPSIRFPGAEDLQRGRAAVDLPGATVAVLVVAASLLGGAGSMYLLGVHEPRGHAALALEPVAGPTTTAAVSSGSSAGQRVAVSHRRSTTMNYTVVASVERVAPADPDHVLAVSTIARHNFTLDPGETWSTAVDPEARSTDGPKRVVYRLYRTNAYSAGGVPSARVHRWLEPDGTTTRNGSVLAGTGEPP